jgi:hypothetical protein
MTLQTDLAAAVAKVTADSTLLHKVVHGPAVGSDSQVVTEGGAVKTVARAVADAEEILHREAGDLVGAVTAARAAKDAAAEYAVEAGAKANAAATAAGQALTVANQAKADIRTVVTATETGLGQLVAQADAHVQVQVSAAGAAATEAEAAAAEARAHCQRFALPIEAVARRAIGMDARHLTGVRDNLRIFSVFADEAGRSEIAAKASAEDAAHQAQIAAGQVIEAAKAAVAAQAHVADAAAVVAQADSALHALITETQSGVTEAKAEISTAASACEDRIAFAAANFETDIQALATATSLDITAAATHVARFAVPIEQVARAALVAEHRRLLAARADLLHFTTMLGS